MRRLLVLWPLMFGVGVIMALTPTERKVVLHAQTELQTAIKAYDEAKRALVIAEQRAGNAESHAKATDQAAAGLKKQVDDSYAKAQALAKSNAEMRPIVDQVNRWWGIGGIIYGFKRLAVHVLILSLVILVLVVIVSVAFPAVGVMLHGLTSSLMVVNGWLWNLLKKIRITRTS